MMSRGLIERLVESSGITYCAGELAETFFNALTAPYLYNLRERTLWVIQNYGHMNDDLLRKTFAQFFDQWVEEFQIVHRSLEAQL